MTLKKSFRYLLLGCVGLALFAPLWAHADQPNASTLPAPGSDRSLVLDVKLHQGGTLVGAFYGDDASPIVGSKILLHQQGQPVAAAVTNEQGQFYMRGLSGGVYELQTKDGNGLCRLWTPNTAPPAAQQALILTTQTETVRGQQFFYDHPYLMRLLDPANPHCQCLTLGMGIAGVAVGVAAIKEAKKGS